MKKRKWLTVAIVGLLAAGCARTVMHEGTHPPVTVPGPDTNVRLNNVSVLDDSLQGRIAVQGTDWQRTATGTLQVWAQLRNRTDYFMQVEVRTQFYDRNQAPVGKPSSWQRVMLSPNSMTTYRENSTGTDPAYYYIEIREGR